MLPSTARLIQIVGIRRPSSSDRVGNGARAAVLVNSILAVCAPTAPPPPITSSGQKKIYILFCCCGSLCKKDISGRAGSRGTRGSDARVREQLERSIHARQVLNRGATAGPFSDLDARLPFCRTRLRMEMGE